MIDLVKTVETDAVVAATVANGVVDDLAVKADATITAWVKAHKWPLILAAVAVVGLLAVLW